MIGDVTVRLERLRHGDFDLAARLRLFAALCESDVEDGNFCAVVRLIDFRNCSLALLALGGMMFGFQRGAFLKRAVCGDAAFGGQFVYASVFVTASDQHKAQRQRKRKE